MTTMMAPMCYHCRHFRNDNDDLMLPNCAAFPDGIPPAIFFWEADHREPQPGDNGIVFAQDPTARTTFSHRIADKVFKKGTAPSP